MLAVRAHPTWLTPGLSSSPAGSMPGAGKNVGSRRRDLEDRRRLRDRVLDRIDHGEVIPNPTPHRTPPTSITQTKDHFWPGGIVPVA